jgi:hypothetical protein
VTTNAAFPFGPKATPPDEDKFTNLSAAGNSAPVGPEPAIAGPGSRVHVSLACVDTSPSTTEPAA